MEFIFATNIDTEIFFLIIKYLKANDWKLSVEYDEQMFDKGIDFDLYQFTKNHEQILLVWSNWFEGEIKATEKTLEEISRHFGFTLKFGQPEYLQDPYIIDKMKYLLKFKI